MDEALAVLGAGSGSRDVGIAPGIAAPLLVRGIASGVRAPGVAVETEGALLVLGGASPGRAGCESGAEAGGAPDTLGSGARGA